MNLETILEGSATSLHKGVLAFNAMKLQAYCSGIALSMHHKNFENVRMKTEALQGELQTVLQFVTLAEARKAMSENPLLFRTFEL